MKKFLLLSVLAFSVLFFGQSSALDDSAYEIRVLQKYSSVVPMNATRFPLMEINIKAKKTISVSEIKLKKSGLASWSDFGNVWVETDNYHRSRKARVTSRDEVRIKFSTPLKIETGNEEKLTVYINLNLKSLGRTFGFSLEDVAIKKVNSREILQHYANYRPRNFYNSARSRSLNRSKPNYSYTNSRRSYAPGSKDVLFLHKYFHERYDFRAEGIFIPVSSSQSENSLENSYNDFRLYIDGNLAGNTNDFETRNGRLGLFFRDNFEANKRGDVRIIGRISHNASNGSSLSFNFYNSEILEKEWAWQ